MYGLCPFCAVYHRRRSGAWFRCLNRARRTPPDVLEQYQQAANAKRDAQWDEYQRKERERIERAARFMGFVRPNEVEKK